MAWGRVDYQSPPYGPNIKKAFACRKSVNSWLHFMEIGPMVGFNQMNSLLLSLTMVGY